LLEFGQPLRLESTPKFAAILTVEGAVMLPRQAIPSQTSRNPSSCGILIADDEPAILEFLKKGLSLYGFTVWPVKDGKEAIEIYQTHRESIAVVLLDVRMPILDGPNTLAILQTINPHILCCFMSGDVGKYSMEELKMSGAAHVLIKPFPLSQVVQVLRSMVSGYETQVA
jgi:two-component system, OmpR family, response regulator